MEPELVDATEESPHRIDIQSLLSLDSKGSPVFAPEILFLIITFVTEGLVKVSRSVTSLLPGLQGFGPPPFQS